MGKVDLLTNTLQPETGSSGYLGIPVLIAGRTGVANFDSGALLTTPGSEVQVASFTTPAGKTRTLHNVMLSCSREGTMKIYHGTVVIGSGRTTGANANISFKFDPGYPISEGDTVAVKFKALAGPAVDVEAFLQSTET